MFQVVTIDGMSHPVEADTWEESRSFIVFTKDGKTEAAFRVARVGYFLGVKK